MVASLFLSQVIFYSTAIIKDAKLSAEMAQVGTIVMGSMNVAMTVISSLMVEAAGRKTLLLIGFVGLLIDTLLLTVCLFISVSYASVEPPFYNDPCILVTPIIPSYRGAPDYMRCKTGLYGLFNIVL